MGFPAKPIGEPEVTLRLVNAQDQNAAGGAAPLTPEHLTMLRDAEVRARKIRRAAAVAAFNGWSEAIFAVISAIFAFADPVGFVAAAVLGFVAYHDLKGRHELLKFEMNATKRLALNQLFLAVALIAYGAWKLWGAFNGDLGIPKESMTGDAQIDSLVSGTVRTATIAVYAGVIAIGLLVPGLTALYYWTRRGVLERFKQQTPAWVIEAMRARV